MKWFLDHQELNRNWLVIRFFGIVIITVFVLMALSTDLIGVLDTFFGLHLNSWESLAYVALAYFSAIVIYMATSFTDSYLKGVNWDQKPPKLPLVIIVGFLFSLPMLLYFAAYEVNHPFDRYILYLPGELDRRKLMVMGLVFIVVLVEAIATATYDLMRQLNRVNSN